MIAGLLECLQRPERLGRIQVTGQEIINLHPNIFSVHDIEPVEVVAAARILEDLIFKLFARSLQRRIKIVFSLRIGWAERTLLNRASEPVIIPARSF